MSGDIFDSVKALRDKAVEATHGGRCPMCQDRIHEGEWIVYDKEAFGWVHLTCAEEAIS